MQKVATPTIFPQPGTYQVSITISLLSETPGASFFYTVDGSLPTRESSQFDPNRLVMLEAKSEGNRGTKSNVILRVIAVKKGMVDSDPVGFSFNLERRDRDAYLVRELHPGVWMINDNDDDRMFLVKGQKKALLIDTGYGAGDLRGTVESLTGGLPIEVAITHAHPDHVAQVNQFQSDCPIFMHHDDLHLLEEFNRNMHFAIDLDRIRNLQEGDVFDLGGTCLRVYHIPGHSAGCLALLDEATGIMYAGDSFGSNRAANADSLWMQFENQPPIDIYLSTLLQYRSRVTTKVNELWTGHNDAPLDEAYLDNLQQACQNLVDLGPESLVPSPRPLDAWQAVWGDRLTDPNWAAINVNRDRCLSAPYEKIASLSNIELQRVGLLEAFSSSKFEYSSKTDVSENTVFIRVISTSSRCQRLAMNGVVIKSGEQVPFHFTTGNNICTIEVTSPDGTVTSVYRLRSGD